MIQANILIVIAAVNCFPVKAYKIKITSVTRQLRYFSINFDCLKPYLTGYGIFQDSSCKRVFCGWLKQHGNKIKELFEDTLITTVFNKLGLSDRPFTFKVSPTAIIRTPPCFEGFPRCQKFPLTEKFYNRLELGLLYRLHH